MANRKSLLHNSSMKRASYPFEIQKTGGVHWHYIKPSMKMACYFCIQPKRKIHEPIYRNLAYFLNSLVDSLRFSHRINYSYDLIYLMAFYDYLELGARRYFTLGLPFLSWLLRFRIFLSFRKKKKGKAEKSCKPI